MKRKLLAAAALLAAPVALFAQASAVPNVISYQGKVTDAGGLLIGSPTPVNRTVTFRIWGTPSDFGPANRLYSEQQTVTIANGEFSVLLGNGSAVVDEENTRALAEVFDGSARFLGITIDDPAVTTDPEISPRQQIVTSAFAFRARVAESVIGQSVTSSMLANNAVGTAQVADSAITLGKLAGNSVDASKIADNAVGTGEIANGAVTASKLGADVGVWSVSGSTVFRPHLTPVGIGTSTPFAPLGVYEGAPFNTPRISLQNEFTGTGYTEGTYLGVNNVNAYLMNHEAGFLDLGTNKVIRQRFEADGRIGFGVLNGDTNLDFYFKGNNRSHVLKVQNSAGAELLTVRDWAAVGINNPSPSDRLAVYDNKYASVRLQTSDTGILNTDGSQFFYDSNAVAYHRSGLWMHDYGSLDFATDNVRRLRLEPDGRMGFGLDNGDANVSFYFMGRTKTTSGGPANQHLALRIVNPDFTEIAAFRADGLAFKPGGGGWSSSSDARLKHDVTDLTGALDRLLQLHPVQFYFNDPDKYGAGQRTGFIAQEVEPVFPEWVTSTEDGYKAITYFGFESYTVQALAELRAEKDAQLAERDAKIQTLEQRLAALEARLESIANSR